MFDHKSNDYNENDENDQNDYDENDLVLEAARKKPPAFPAWERFRRCSQIGPVTGRSKATVTNDFSVTNPKNEKYGITQSFLESWYAAVLVFWCLSMVRWTKVVIFWAVPKWCFGSILQGLGAQVPSKHIQAPQNSMITTQIPQNTPQTSQRHPPDISREHNIPTDANRHRQTPQNTERRCLSMSGGVNWRLLLSVCMSCSMEMSGGCLWDIWGVSGDIWVVFMEIRGAWMCLGGIWALSPCSMEPKHHFSTALSQLLFTWPYWDIKIPKPPHISFPKMIGLGQFFYFLGSPEKNHLWQLLLIALYIIFCKIHLSIFSRLTMSISI